MNKKFLIILILAIVVLSTNVWAIPDPCSNKEDGADCGENFPCCTCYNETSKYNETQDNDCDDLVEIDTCIWDPDDNPFTLDYHAPVEGFCVSLFTCSNPTYGKFTHTCDITNCDAECELDDNCEPYMEEEGPVFRLLEDVKRPSTGSVCNYAGFCDSCECDYEEDWCPEPGFEEQEGERDSSWPICYYDVTCESDGCDYEDDDCDAYLENETCYYGPDCDEEFGCDYDDEECLDFYMEDNTCYYDVECEYWGGCEYDGDEDCPESGIYESKEGGDYCIYNVECTDDGCDYNEEPMNESNECDPKQGPVTMPPTTILVDGYTNSWTLQTSWDISFKAEDVGSWVTNSYWRTNNNSWANVVNSYSDNPFYFNKTFELDEGEHILEYYSVDYARNTEITNQVPIRIDLTNPEVNVGSDKSSTDSVDVDATTLDNLSGIDTYLWEKISGPGIITFSNEDEEDTEISADETGTYTIRLTVTDNAGNSNYDELDYTMEESKSSRGSRGGPVKVCEPNWTCSEWLECSIDEIQIRTCTDLEECNTNRDQPDLEQDCTYISPQEPEPVMPESVIPEINQTQNTTNTTNGNGVTGAVVGPIQGNPLGDFFGNFWDWLLGLF